ncbi:SHOCT domain-containing protein [Dactylosporangium sp. NPDC005555]|uniref:SHOCT domain-containing protein n=1 Tax=Dactylosporangium sp. NPDC005555 TaxID=3154889 RepID=UPI0033A04D96
MWCCATGFPRAASVPPAPAGSVVLVRSVDRGGSPVHAAAPQATAPRAAAPQEVLADRFARGEIDEEEYTRCLRVLHTTPGGT